MSDQHGLASLSVSSNPFPTLGPRSKRPSGNCQKCGTFRKSLHREHIIPKWKGGPDDAANIQWLCANCHEDKSREDLRGIPGTNKGRKFSAESRQKMSESASRSQARAGHTKGLKFSEKRRIAHSEAMKKAFALRPRAMPPASEERKRKVSESLKRYHQKKREASNAI